MRAFLQSLDEKVWQAVKIDWTKPKEAPACYREGHLPGAVFIDLERDLAAPPGPAGRHPLPDPAVFTAAMRAAGVSEDRPVVVYDDRDATAAARAWWLLRYHGHQNVRVLDGGYQAWLAAGLPVTRADPAAKPGDFTARPGHMPVLDAAGAQDVAETGLLLDARSGERYREIGRAHV